MVRNVVNRLGMVLMTRQAFALAGCERTGFEIPTHLPKGHPPGPEPPAYWERRIG